MARYRGTRPALVAFEEERPLGTISLLEESLGTHKHLTPWLGGLYVCEGEMRRRGIGTRLIEASVGEARRLGAGQVFVGIRRAEDYYSRLGWEAVERTNLYGEGVAIMRLDLCREVPILGLLWRRGPTAGDAKSVGSTCPRKNWSGSVGKGLE